jgi:hypothetical protein
LTLLLQWAVPGSLIPAQPPLFRPLCSIPAGWVLPEGLIKLDLSRNYGLAGSSLPQALKLPQSLQWLDLSNCDLAGAGRSWAEVMLGGSGKQPRPHRDNPDRIACPPPPPIAVLHLALLHHALLHLTFFHLALLHLTLRPQSWQGLVLNA